MRTYDRNFKLIRAGADFVCLPGYALFTKKKFVEKFVRKKVPKKKSKKILKIILTIFYIWKKTSVQIPLIFEKKFENNFCYFIFEKKVG